jgi:chromosome partitioning protein
MISLIVTAKPYKTERIMTDGDVLTVPRRKAATEIKTAQNKAKSAWIVLYSSPKGGVGKTSCCKNTAVAAARDGLRVATIDLDRQRTLTQWCELRKDQDVVQFDHFEGRLDHLDKVLSVIDLTAYDIIMVDTPPSVEDHPVAVKRLVLMADLVIVPSGSPVFDRNSVKPWMQLLRTYGKPAAFLLNRVKRRATSLRDAKTDLIRSGRLCPVEVPDLEDMHKVDEIGYSVVDVDGAGGAEECVNAWHFIKNELGI